MWQQNVTKLLSHLGWGSGFRLPIANEENLDLERLLEEKQRIIQERRAELEDLVKHTSILEKGIKSAGDHINLEAKILNAKTTEIQSETELFKRSERELQRLDAEKRTTETKFIKAHQVNKQLCIEIDSRRRFLNDLVQTIEYSREELAALEKKAEDDDVHLHMLEQVCIDDDETLQKYQARYKIASAELAASREELEREVAGTQVLQHELDTLSNQFRKLHRERGEVVGLWKGTLISLSQRDAQLKTISEEYTNLLVTLNEKDGELCHHRTRLSTCDNSSQASSLSLHRRDRVCSDLRENQQELEEQSQVLRDNCLSYETSIQLASQQIAAARKATWEIERELKEMEEKVQRGALELEELRARAKVTEEEIGGANAQMRGIYDLVEEEERKLQILAKLMEKEMVHKSQWGKKKNQLQSKSRDLEHALRLVNANYTNLSSKVKDGVFMMEKRKSLIYKMEIRVISLELKHKPYLNPKSINNTDTDYLEKEHKIQVLKKELREVIQIKSFVTNQAGHLDDVNRRIYREKLIAEKNVQILSQKFDEHHVYVLFAQKSLKKVADEHQDTIVDQSMVKLRLSHLNKILANQKTELYDMGQHRELLIGAGKEKRLEIEEHARLLELLHRELKNSVVDLRVQMNQVKASIDKKRLRYDFVMRLMGSEWVTEDSELRSEAYFILKMAQEREILTREGDKWDTKVKEAEQETEALQNSLSLVACSNEMFKDSLKPMKDEQFERKLNEVKLQESKLQSRKRKAARAILKLADEIRAKEEKLETLEHQKYYLENKTVDNEYQLRCLQGDLNNQAQSDRRARMITQKLLQVINFSSPEEKSVVSLDIRLRATRMKLEFALQALVKVFALHPQVFESAFTILLKNLGESLTTKVLEKVTPLTPPPSATPSMAAQRQKSTVPVSSSPGPGSGAQASVTGLSLKEVRSRGILKSTTSKVSSKFTASLRPT